jgi:predicted NUDIX family phosphoesterase
MKHQEHIVAIKASALAHLPEGINRIGLIPFSEQFGHHTVIAQRASLEVDENYRQVIPYFMLIDKTNGNVIVPYRRVGGGEDRLLDKVSIGFGGHVDLIDLRGGDNSHLSLIDTILGAVHRELGEEVEFAPAPDGQEHNFGMFDVGVLIDNSNEVGRVHVGVVLAIDINTELPFSSKEEGIEMLTPGTPAEILAAGYNLENWSKIVLEHLATPFEEIAPKAGVAELAE